jgi:hypothetical protein
MVGRVETKPKEPKTMTTGSDHVDEGAVELLVRPWDRPGEAKLYVKPEHEKELGELLTAAGISHGRVYEFHYEPIFVAIAISVGGPAAWKALATVITAFLQRNDRKSIKVNMNGESMEFAAYSARQVEHMIDRMAELHQQQQQRWEQFTGRDHPPAGEVESGP